MIVVYITIAMDVPHLTQTSKISVSMSEIYTMRLSHRQLITSSKSVIRTMKIDNFEEILDTWKVKFNYKKRGFKIALDAVVIFDYCKNHIGSLNTSSDS